MITRITLTMAASFALTTPALADDVTFKLEALTCFEVQSQSQDDSLFLTGMLIGHAMGDAEMSAEAIKSAVEAMDATCGENPDMLAIEALPS